MIELARIVEHQASLSSYRATQNEERAAQLEFLIEATKPKNLYPEWHPLISSPFRYGPPPPGCEARFRPAYGKNVFYGALLEEIALYEHAYHFMKQRIHLDMETDSGLRTIFFVESNNNNSIHIINESNCDAIMRKDDYSASHVFVKKHPKALCIIYPSCRDPHHRDNAAILDISLLNKNIKWQSNIQYFYDNKKKIINWIDYGLHIHWNQVD